MKSSFALVLLSLGLTGCVAIQAQHAHIPPDSFRGSEPVTAQSDGNMLVEAEEFSPANDAWAAKP